MADRERTTNNIPVETFRPEMDDFDEWIGLFEGAVCLATNPQTGPRKHALFKEWLPIKLDDSTRMIYSNCDKAAEWDPLKNELKKLLVDPQDRYNWRTGRSKIVWDGKESFHVLGTRVKRNVDKLNDAPRESDYFHDFRKAVPPLYQQAIDFGSVEETLTEAKRLAFKFHAVRLNAASDASVGATGDKSVAFTGAFTGASMSDDRLKAMEMSLQGMTVKVDNINDEMKKLKVDDQDGRSQTPGRPRYEARPFDRSPSRGRDPRSGDGNRDFRRRESPENRGSYGRRDGWNRRDSREREGRDRYRNYDDRSFGSERDRRDSYECRPYGDQGYNDRWRSDSRGRRFDSRDRGYGDRVRQFSRDRDNRDRRYSPGPYSPGRRDNDRGFPRRDSRERQYGREQQGGPQNAQRENRPFQGPRQNEERDGRPPQGGGNLRSAELEDQFQWFCSAILEKEEKDSKN